MASFRRTARAIVAPTPAIALAGIVALTPAAVPPLATAHAQTVLVPAGGGAAPTSPAGTSANKPSAGTRRPTTPPPIAPEMALTGGPLSLENARPAAIPPAPRMTPPPTPPAPPKLDMPAVMAVPDVPLMAAPEAVPTPPAPAGAPPIPKSAAPPPVAAQRPTPTPPAPAPSRPVASAPAPIAEPARGTEPAPAVASEPLPAPASVAFAPESSEPPAEADVAMREIAATLNGRPRLRLQLRAYAAGTPDTERQARQLSLARALAVRERLTALGIRSTRIDVRPLGSAVPSDRPTPADRVDLEYING